ncbi:MAG: hypothetical protein H6873_11745 [Hyphomicrobiaceae bacterium]|nr:hypothetical protein [Hyphomicrobiaceae bacterium]
MATFLVTNSKASGKGSLAWAINKANDQAGDDVVKFDGSLAGKTIRPLNTLTLTDNVQIIGIQSGGGLPKITISGDRDKSGTGNAGDLGIIFDVQNNANVDFFGLKITSGFALGADAVSPGASGDLAVAGLRVATGSLTIEDSIITRNTAIAGDGSSAAVPSFNPGALACGGIYVASGANLTVLDSTISNNSATGGSAAYTTGFTGNRGGSAGGGIWNDGGSVTINGSMFTDNTATGGAGGGTNYAAGTGGNGGGATGGVYQYNGTTTGDAGFYNCVVFGGAAGTGNTPGNVGQAGPGYIYTGGTFSLVCHDESSPPQRFGTNGADNVQVLYDAVYAGRCGNDTFNNSAGHTSYARGGGGDDVFNWAGAPLDGWGANGGSGSDRFKFFGNVGGTSTNPGIFDGGRGIDTSDFSAVTSGGVVVDLSSQSTNQNLDLKNVENVIGTNLVGAFDSISGNNFNNTIRGFNGPNNINGFGGNDMLIGGNQVDNIDGGRGNDLIKTGRGNDNVDGEQGNDRIFLQGGNNSIFAHDNCDRDNIFGFRDNHNTLFLQDDLWGGKNMTVNQVINKFGSFHNGVLNLNFGHGNEIDIHGLPSLNAFKNDCSIFP